jgi:hypothetical protein
MEWVFENGRRTRVPFIDRGGMLVYSEDEWKGRYKYHIDMFAGAFVFVIFIFLLIDDIILEVDWTLHVSKIVLITATGLAFGITGYSIAIRYLNAGRAVPGVYEGGVQLSFSTAYPTFRRVFLPYSEIERAIWQGSKGERTVALFLHRSNRTINLNQHYFGMDGIRVVKAVVGGRVTIPKVAGERG